MTSSDAPQPPGGPLREDAPDGPMAPGDGTEGDDKPDHGVPRVSFGDSSGDEPEVTEEPAQGDEERSLQEENAETSLDQPSS
ncbi:MAG: hypothetical protein JHD21_06670 [Nocardioides sp.]|nr:hypothetical protein [Nocardioides sp.]